MAEYDNLLAWIDARRAEWSEFWKPVEESDLAHLFEAAAAVRALQTENTNLKASERAWSELYRQRDALQTENTELREHKDALIAEWSGKAADRLAKLVAAERVITAVRKTTDAVAQWDYIEPPWQDVIDAVSSYPLGEGQTQEEGKA